ncbi:hypothetical protein AB0M36_05055 [Actinoplanes sp. NPDC051346]|uniref:hypothetical protein n=1 Tax=Actinoplanes sp. NPDC051346 TaxID=3155048 RepID=UPI0034180660
MAGKTGPLLRRAAEMEAAMWRSMYVWARRKPLELAPGDETFSYLGVVKPILGVLIALSVVEIPILDIIIKNVVPWQPARLIMLVLSIWGLLWMLGLLASLKIHPHVVGDAGIRVRMGAGPDFTVAWEQIESVSKSYRSMPSSKSVQYEDDHGRRVLHIVAGSQTSVDVRLRRPTTVLLPQGESEPVEELRLYADDPEALVRKALGHVKAATHAEEG